MKTIISYKSAKPLIIILILILLCFCVDKKSKTHYRFTERIQNNLYIEYYEPGTGGAGIFSGSLRSAYLTDSANINIFLFAYHDDEGFDVFLDSIQFKALKYRNILIDFNKFPKKEYFDSVIVDLKTKKRIK
jgi:hypothetical protein